MALASTSAKPSVEQTTCHDRWISQYAGDALSIIDRLKSDLEA